MREKRMLPIALVPLIFAVQQFAEGIQWMSDKSGLVSAVAGYFFLFLAFSFWPVYIPFAIFLVEKNYRRKRFIQLCIMIGAVVGILGLAFLIAKPLSVIEASRHIEYIIAIPLGLGILPYLFAIVGSCFASSYKIIRWLGGLIIVFLPISWWISSSAFGSIWCFFAAVLSGIIYFF